MYGLEPYMKDVKQHYLQYRGNVINAIKNREKWWIQKCKTNTYLRKEGSIANVFFDNCLNKENYLKMLLSGKPDELLDFVREFIGRGDKTLFKESKVNARKKLEPDEICILEKIKVVDDKTKAGGILTGEEKELIRQRDILLVSKGMEDFNRAVWRIFVGLLYDLEFDKKAFVRSLNLRICPYCGRNYIFHVEKDSRLIKPQIDHFLPKSQFPFLAISYHNLIPCCNVCNVEIKGESVPLNDSYDAYSIPHPYNYADEWNFIFKLKGIDSFSDFSDNRTECIEVGFEGDEDILNSHEELFGIQTLYAGHNDLVSELLIKKQFWASESVQEYYKNILETKYELGAKMILAILGYSEDPNESGKRPFMKLLRDISVYYDKLVKEGKKKS